MSALSLEDENVHNKHDRRGDRCCRFRDFLKSIEHSITPFGGNIVLLPMTPTPTQTISWRTEEDGGWCTPYLEENLTIGIYIDIVVNITKIVIIHMTS